MADSVKDKTRLPSATRYNGSQDSLLDDPDVTGDPEGEEESDVLKRRRRRRRAPGAERTRVGGEAAVRAARRVLGGAETLTFSRGTSARRSGSARRCGKKRGPRKKAAKKAGKGPDAIGKEEGEEGEGETVEEEAGRGKSGGRLGGVTATTVASRVRANSALSLKSVDLSAALDATPAEGGLPSAPRVTHRPRSTSAGLRGHRGVKSPAAERLSLGASTVTATFTMPAPTAATSTSPGALEEYLRFSASPQTSSQPGQSSTSVTKIDLTLHPNKRDGDPAATVLRPANPRSLSAGSKARTHHGYTTTGTRISAPDMYAGSGRPGSSSTTGPGRKGAAPPNHTTVPKPLDSNNNDDPVKHALTMRYAKSATQRASLRTLEELLDSATADGSRFDPVEFIMNGTVGGGGGGRPLGVSHGAWTLPPPSSITNGDVSKETVVVTGNTAVITMPKMKSEPRPILKNADYCRGLRTKKSVRFNLPGNS